MLSKSSTTEFRSQHSEIIFKSINLKKIVIEEPLPRKIILLIQCRNELVFEFPAPPFHALMSRLMSSLLFVVCSHSFPCLIILHMLQVPSIKLSQSHEAHRVLISYCLFKRAFIADVSFFFFFKKSVCVYTSMYIGMRQPMWKSGQTCSTQFFSSTLWVLAIKLQSPDLEAAAFLC